MAYRVLNGMAPPYLNQLVSVSSLPGRRRLWSSFTLQLHITHYRSTVCQQLAVAHFLSQPPFSGTLCQLTARHLAECSCFTSQFPDIIVYISLLRYCGRGLCNSLGYFSHAKNS